MSTPQSKPEPKLAEFSPITYGVLRFFDFLKYFSVMRWLSPLNEMFQSRSEFKDFNPDDHDFIIKRTRAIEMYILGWLVVEILLSLFFCLDVESMFCVPLTTIFRILGSTIVVLRIVEIVQVSVNTTIFDVLNGLKENLIASSARMIVLAGINFIELIVCFGIIYAANYSGLSSPAADAGRPITAFYFSVITQLTIGYGDVAPMGWLRIVAVMQGLTGTLFLVLIFGRFVSALRPISTAFKN